MALAGVNVGSGNIAQPEPTTVIPIENLIAGTIAEAMSLSFYETESPKTQLLAYLRSKNLLLVVDNFEHLVAQVDFILTLLNPGPPAIPASHFAGTIGPAS